MYPSLEKGSDFCLHAKKNGLESRWVSKIRGNG
jgi:hypothetical protein